MEHGFFYTLTAAGRADVVLNGIGGVLLLDFSDGANRTICFASSELVTAERLRELNPGVALDVVRQIGVRAGDLMMHVQAVKERVSQAVDEIVSGAKAAIEL